MKKGNKKKQIQSNPVYIQYAYMDKMPLEGWIWEFIRRSKSYRYEYEKVEEAVRNSVEEIDKVINHFQEKVAQMNLNVHLHLNDEPNLNYFLKIKEGMYIPKPQAKYVDISKGIYIKGTSPLEVASYEEYTEDEYMKQRRRVSEGCHVFGEVIFDEYEVDPAIPLVFDLAVPTPKDTIYVGISRKAKIADIEKHLFPILSDYLEPRKPKIRDDKWKYYLICYDLRKPKSKFSDVEIVKILADAYPKQKNLFKERNIDNYFMNALRLIEDGYKDYLY